MTKGVRNRRRIAIQGVSGCFHEAAARGYFGEEEIEFLECRSFRELFERLHGDRSLSGVVAIENTIAGSLLQNHELLRESDLWIAGEYKLRISHVLAALPGETIERIAEVNSHPIALMQCAEFLQRHPQMKVVEKDDTAGSAAEIAVRGLNGHAAICGALAARLYGLDILAEGIETNKRNFTRFLIVGDRSAATELTGGRAADKASLVFSLPHTQGSLSKVLTILSFYDINLTKIQSTPIIGSEWEYLFYIDITFTDFTRYRQALEAIRPLTNGFKILGEYAAFKSSF